jgi:hypothetical protein
MGGRDGLVRNIRKLLSVGRIEVSFGVLIVGVVVFGLKGPMDLLNCSFKRLIYTKCKLKEWNTAKRHVGRI